MACDSALPITASQDQTPTFSERLAKAEPFTEFFDVGSGKVCSNRFIL
jgi:hypothetical protein